MGDSWEDESFEVPSIVPVNSSSAKESWEDEDETVIEEKIVKTAPTQAQIDAAKKKIEQEEILLQNHVKYSAYENETPEEKKLRERKQAEDEDIALAGEMFGKLSTNNTLTNESSSKASSSGLGGILLKTKQEHINFSIMCSKKLADSTPLNIGSYLKSLMDKLKDNLTIEMIDEITASLNKTKEDKKKFEANNKNKTVKKSKKEISAENQKHRDVFGGLDDDDNNDKYDHYSNMQDDFM
jgi:hypothetical protein